MTDFEKIFRLMNEILDREMQTGLIQEFELRLGDAAFQDFFNTFKRTVELCRGLEREFEDMTVPQDLHISLIQAIQQTPQKLPAKRKKKKPKKH